jgi:hypothetical protein
MTRTGVPFALAIAIGCSVASLRAAPLPGLPGADEIVARHAEARGGLEKIRGLHSLIYRGAYHEGDDVMPEAAMAVMRPFYKLVGDPEKPDPHFAEGYDGSAWELYGDPGIVVRTVGAAAAAARHGLAIDGPLVDYKEKGSTVEVRGIEKIGGKETYWLRVHMRDGFEEDEFIDRQTWLLTASRKVAPIHAFGKAVSTETRFGDFRPVAGVLFPFSDAEVEIATGKVLNEMHWREIVANKDLDPAVFSPPALKRTPLQTLIDHLFMEREDREAVLWSYFEFRRAFPDVDSDKGMQSVGYHILKMGDLPSAIALLEANATAYPRSSGAFFALGRAYNTAERPADARTAFEKALALDPANKRARAALDALAKPAG